VVDRSVVVGTEASPPVLAALRLVVATSGADGGLSWADVGALWLELAVPPEVVVASADKVEGS
jgi:hypothetical protein